MGRKSQREEEHTFLGIKVDRFDASVGSGLNLNLLGPIPWEPDENELVFVSRTGLEIHGISIDPPERANELYRRLALGFLHMAGKS
jgi:hypothetical protein